jgi:hypothetical protein
MTKDEALKLALETLETLMIERGSIYDQAITAIKEALAQPEQTPYITMPPSTPMWTIPLQRTWVELTDDEIQSLDLSNYVQVVRIVQAKLKAKNT